MTSLHSSFLCHRLLSHCWQRSLVQSWLLCVRRIPFSLTVIIGELDVGHIFICTNRQHAIQNGNVNIRKGCCPAAPDPEACVPAAVAVMTKQSIYQAKKEQQACTGRKIIFSAKFSLGNWSLDTARMHVQTICTLALLNFWSFALC